MAFSPAALFRRDKVKDPFGGEDLNDGESRFAGKGPKIALAASGMMFLLLMGGVGAIIATHEEPEGPPVLGSFADLEIAEDVAPPAPVAAPTAPPAAAPKKAPAPAAPAVVPDSTAATDRSVDRRPWLAASNAAPAAPTPRPGMAGPAPTGVTPVVPPPPVAKPAEVKPLTPPAPIKAAETHAAPEVKTPDAKVPALTPPPSKPPESKVAAVMAPPPVTMPAATAPKTVSLPAPAATPSAKPPAPAAKSPELPAVMPAAMPAEDELDPSKDIAGIPALKAAGSAPGAPRRFDPATGDAGPAVAGGRPRLVEPPLPPTDKITLSAPPPRYANLTDIKRDAAGAAAPAANATRLAFVVDGLGLSQSATDAAINKLPANVMLAFSPYTRDLKKWMAKAKEKGHEVLIEVPMESKQFPAEDPGPLGLLTSVEVKDNTDRLEAILKESAGAVGVLDTMGTKFRESGPHIDLLFAKLKQVNLFYVQGSAGVRVGEASVPTAISDVTIDERPFRAAIDARLDYAERLAKYQGSAVVSLSAKPVSFERLVLWLEQAQKKGVTLAPISQVLIK